MIASARIFPISQPRVEAEWMLRRVARRFISPAMPANKLPSPSFSAGNKRRSRTSGLVSLALSLSARKALFRLSLRGEAEDRRARATEADAISRTMRQKLKRDPASRRFRFGRVGTRSSLLAPPRERNESLDRLELDRIFPDHCSASERHRRDEEGSSVLEVLSAEESSGYPRIVTSDVRFNEPVKLSRAFSRMIKERGGLVAAIAPRFRASLLAFPSRVARGAARSQLLRDSPRESRESRANRTARNRESCFQCKRLLYPGYIYEQSVPFYRLTTHVPALSIARTERKQITARDLVRSLAENWSRCLISGSIASRWRYRRFPRGLAPARHEFLSKHDERS